MKILLALLSFLLVISATAQPYHKAIGVKFPAGTGITFKKFITPVVAMEFQALYGERDFRLVGLYAFHFPFSKAEGLSWYAGPGAHLRFYKHQPEKNHSSKMDLGIDGVLGIDYKFGGMPVNLSLDWQPSISLTGNAGTRSAYGGVAIRYTL